VSVPSLPTLAHRPGISPSAYPTKGTKAEQRKAAVVCARFALGCADPAGELDVLLEALGMKETQR
jgi:hypothetical protein